MNNRRFFIRETMPTIRGAYLGFTDDTKKLIVGHVNHRLLQERMESTTYKTPQYVDITLRMVKTAGKE
jgi:hypothetical protein